MVVVSVGMLKKDGKTKYVKLLGKGILTLVDHLFWNLPFCSVKQSQAVRKKAGVTEPEKEWSTKWEEIVAEHDLPGAREQLASGWKEYLGKRAGEAARASGAGAVRPACLSTVVLDTP